MALASAYRRSGTNTSLDPLYDTNRLLIFLACDFARLCFPSGALPATVQLVRVSFSFVFVLPGCAVCLMHPIRPPCLLTQRYKSDLVVHELKPLTSLSETVLKVHVRHSRL
jgi:hypothetical protein